MRCVERDRGGEEDFLVFIGHEKCLCARAPRERYEYFRLI